LPKSNLQRLLDTLEELGGVATPEQLSFELGWTVKGIGHMMTRLAQRGLVKRREYRILYEMTGRALNRNVPRSCPASRDDSKEVSSETRQTPRAEDAVIQCSPQVS